MNYSLEFSRRAFNYLRRLPRSSQDRFRVRIVQIAENPYGLHTKALAGSEGYRASRVGGWRIIFRVDDAQRHVIVLEIGPRGQVYRGI